LKAILYKYDKDKSKIVVDKTINLEKEWYDKAQKGKWDEMEKEIIKRFGLSGE